MSSFRGAAIIPAPQTHSDTSCLGVTHPRRTILLLGYNLLPMLSSVPNHLHRVREACSGERCFGSEIRYSHFSSPNPLGFSRYKFTLNITWQEGMLRVASKGA